MEEGSEEVHSGRMGGRMTGWQDGQAADRLTCVVCGSPSRKPRAHMETLKMMERHLPFRNLYSS